MRITIELPDNPSIDFIEVKASYAEFVHTEKPEFSLFGQRPKFHTQDYKLHVDVAEFIVHTKDGQIIDGEVLDDVVFTTPSPREIEG